MPWQLIYTSAPRGLAPGQSGFCTVARSPDLRDGLAQRLEQLSSYDHSAQTGADGATSNPVICAHRILDLRGTRFHVLTRIVDAGLDFTRRTNHLAHHLVFEPAEVAALPSPAALLLRWDGWRSEWNEEPRFLLPHELTSLDRVPRAFPLPARGWQQVTGDAGTAAGLLEFAAGAYLLDPPGGETELLQLFGETSQLLDSSGQSAAAWQLTFTTFLQGTDSPSDFRWRGGRAGSPAFVKAASQGIALTPLDSINAPDNDLSHLARHGKLPPRLRVPETPASPGGASSRTVAPKKLTYVKKDLWAEAQKGGSGQWKDEEEEAQEEPGSSRHPLRMPLAGIAAIVLFVVLVGGFVKPGWFLKRDLARGSSPSAPAPLPSTNPASTTNLPPPPATNVNPADSPKPKVVPDPTPADLQHLHAVWDDLSNRLAVIHQTTPLEIRDVPELNQMIEAIRRYEILERDVQCFLTAGSNVVLHGIGEPANFKLETVSQFARVADKVRLEFQPGEPVRLTCETTPAKFTAIVFRPVAGKEQAFSPFRLVLLNGASSPNPIKLDKSFLLADRNGPFGPLRPPLHDRVASLQLINSTNFQFEPYGRVETNPVVKVFEQWSYPVALGTELQYTAHRAVLKDSLRDLNGQLGGIKVDIKALDAKHHREEELDFELGKPFGLPLTNRLYSFARFCASGRLLGDRFSFIQYLREVVKHQQLSVTNEINRGLDIPEQRGEALRKLQAGYFPSFTNLSFEVHWTALETADDFAARARSKSDLLLRKGKLEKDQKTLEKRIDETKKLQARLPKDIRETHHVRLLLLGPHLPMELIRFAGIREEAPP